MNKEEKETLIKNIISKQSQPGGADIKNKEKGINIPITTNIEDIYLSISDLLNNVSNAINCVCIALNKGANELKDKAIEKLKEKNN